MNSIKNLEKIIFQLIESGEDDGASKCGHDEEVDEWNKAKRRAMKVLSPEKIREMKEEVKRERAEKERKAEKAFLDKEKKNDKKILEEFNLTSEERAYLKL